MPPGAILLESIDRSTSSACTDDDDTRDSLTECQPGVYNRNKVMYETVAPVDHGIILLSCDVFERS